MLLHLEEQDHYHYSPVTRIRCNFSCNLQWNSSLKSRYVMANCDGNMSLPTLHLPRVELRCELHEKLHRVPGPFVKVRAM